MQKQIVMVCGLPLTGKSTIGKKLKRRLAVPFVDIDVVRHKLFQQPQAEMRPIEDHFQMRTSYGHLFLLAYRLIKKGHSCIITATFSRELYHEGIRVLSEATNTPIKAIYCWAPDEVIKQRIGLREERQDSFSTCRTFKHYKSDVDRYQCPPFEMLRVDTSQPLEENIQEIIRFVNS